MKYSLLILLLCACTMPAFAGYTGTDDSTGVVLHADKRLDLLVKSLNGGVKTAKGNGRGGVIRSGKGFRVQIYNGPDRAVAMKKKVEFIRRFPGVRSYMSYISPMFRVKVGDFRTRQEAQKFYQQVSGAFSPSMIVPDIIEINTLRDNNDD